MILAYYWPPSGGSGVQRWLKFVKYLRHYGWEPVVITPENGTAPYYDETLQRDVPEGVKVYKTATFEPFEIYNRLQGKKKDAPIPVGMVGIKDAKSTFQKIANYIRANLFVPDARMGWKSYAVKAALQAIQENPEICAMVTTGPPHSVHLAGLELKEKTGLPWLADLRDPWTNIYYNQSLPRTERTKQKDKALEDKVLATANAVTVVSGGMADEFKSRAKHLEVIFNGYDDDDIYKGENKPSEFFTLAHVGNFFPYYDSEGLWEAIAQLCKENMAFAERFRLCFTGVTDGGILQKIKEKGLEKWLVVNGSVPHKEATKQMFEAAMLLFVIPNDGSKGVITGKVFEYIASETPILPIGDTTSNVANILREQGHLSMADYGDTATLKNYLKNAFEAWLAGGQKTQKMEGKGQNPYSRKALTGKLAELLNKITAS